jgi:hypothetical protein
MSQQSFQSSQSKPATQSMPSYSGSGASSSYSVYSHESEKMNNFALASVATAVGGLFSSMCGGILCSPIVILSLVLAGIGYYQIKQFRHKGQEFVIAAFVINIVAIIIILSSAIAGVFFAAQGN